MCNIPSERVPRWPNFVPLKTLRNPKFQPSCMIDVEKETERAYPLFGKMKNDALDLRTEILEGDCLDALAKFPVSTFDLIVTSPPYADQRSKTYGGIKPDEYVEWFIERSAEFQRVLKPSGTFILNIKEKAEQSERHTYLLDLILALRKRHWQKN